MRQILQDIRSGDIGVHEVPAPIAREGWVLVATANSLISSGTERAIASLGAKSLLNKARARPDLVRKTLGVARAEGVSSAVTKVRSRLEQYSSFGYSLSGRVVDTGGDPRLAQGGFVACVGAEYATHAEFVSVPRNLVVPLPEGVTTEEGAFAAPASIALHALRLAGIEPGAVVAVVGLGLIGQLAGRLLEASGCKAVGSDPNEARCALFGEAGSPDVLRQRVAAASRGRGADAVVVCAATGSSEPVALAAETARDRGTVVVVGDVGLELDRRIFYEKELSFAVARSYGPGRYDRAYEEGGGDYPFGYIRWTEGRNVEAVLDLVARGQCAVADLVSHRFQVQDGADAYATLQEDPAALAIMLEYGESRAPQVTAGSFRPRQGRSTLRVGLVGAGTFARGTLIPALRDLHDVEITAVCTRSGATAKAVADHYDVPVTTTDWRQLVDSEDVDALVVATPHSTHAEIAVAALGAGKHVFVEKPLAISLEELEQVARAADQSAGVLLVGHNRRFAPLVQRLRDTLTVPLLIQIRVAAGALDDGHWLTDPYEGGRILGEISHFVDLATYLARSYPVGVAASTVPTGGGAESLAGLLQFENGGAATLVYSVGPAGNLGKEMIEVFSPSGAAALDDYTRLDLHGYADDRVKSRRDKGHRAQLEAFVRAAQGSVEPPVQLREQLVVAAASLALVEAARTRERIDVRQPI